MNYDVIVCGGGLAGLCIARQLRFQNQEISILVLDRLERPLQETTFKVGESTIEVGAYYFNKVMGLEDYMGKEHYEKLGLRYFYGNGTQPLETRPEYGVSQFLPAKSVQLNRGKFENHLRGLLKTEGIDLWEGVMIRNILIQDAPNDHEVIYKITGEAETKKVKGKWIVDASGRSRILQKKFNLTKHYSYAHSAAWFRIDGVLDVAELVPRSKVGWHHKVKEKRWFSTNHLMGEGYWVWLIPINPNHTSVGIVTAEYIHPIASYNTVEKAMEWIKKHEPLLEPQLKNFNILDFKLLKNYSYSSHKVFSENRWACVGEAGVFGDPYYSIGSNMIAYSNGITTHLILSDLKDRQGIAQEKIDYFNKFYLSLNESLTYTIQSVYPILNKAKIMLLKTIWDFGVALGLSDPLYYQDIYLNPKLSGLVSELISPVTVTQARLIRLFQDWAKYPQNNNAFGFVDYIADLPTLTDLLVRNTKPVKKNFSQVLQDIKYGFDRLEELAHVIFFMALEDTMPEQLARFRNNRWINMTAISLDSGSWEKDGLFHPTTSARDFSSLEHEIQSLFRMEAEVLDR